MARMVLIGELRFLRAALVKPHRLPAGSSQNQNICLDWSWSANTVIPCLQIYWCWHVLAGHISFPLRHLSLAKCGRTNFITKIAGRYSRTFLSKQQLKLKQQKKPTITFRMTYRMAVDVELCLWEMVEPWAVRPIRNKNEMTEDDKAAAELNKMFNSEKIKCISVEVRQMTKGRKRDE